MKNFIFESSNLVVTDGVLKSFLNGMVEELAFHCFAVPAERDLRVGTNL